jgi:hypothetical protein
MTVVVPKILHVNGSDTPVWEIIAKDGDKIYFERPNRRGFRPVGSPEPFNLGSAKVSVFDTVRVPRNVTPVVYRERDGYCAPSTWYERDPNYCGPLVHSREDFDDELTHVSDY